MNIFILISIFICLLFQLWQFSKSEKNSIFSQILSPESLSSFSWKKLLEEAEKTLPTAIQLLRAFFPDEKHFARKGTLQYDVI